jgi:hypothetical protein
VPGFSLVRRKWNCRQDATDWIGGIFLRYRSRFPSAAGVATSRAPGSVRFDLTGKSQVTPENEWRHNEQICAN